MNFFEHQERARKNSTRLVLLFGVAVLLIGLALYAASRAVVRATCEQGGGEPCTYGWWDAKVLLIYLAATAAFIGLASLFKILTLQGGGGSVALMMGGQQVLPGTTDARERRLVNVVEEMAIASGVPVPLIFVLQDESGINAFAAGWSPQDAAVAVTRGALDTLTRDELQGVIAHEFSHVLNGDMRLNIKMIGVIFGILAIGEVGRLVLRMTWYSGGRVRRSSKKDSGGAAVIALSGLALMLIGYIGTFIGRMIQAALSRQREFLADASAVQFTRNPGGISGALKKIGGLSEGSRLAAPAAGQVGHLLFGEGVGVRFLSGLLATHPPLSERVRRLEPGFAGVYDETRPSAAPDLREFVDSGAQAMAMASRAAPARGRGAVGKVDAQAVEQAAGLLRAIPRALRGGLASPEEATRLITALALPAQPDLRGQALEDLRQRLGASEVAAIAAFRQAAEHADPRLHLALVDLATPLLRGLARADAARLVERVEALTVLDGQVDVFEFALHWLLVRRLSVRGKASARTHRRGLAALKGPIAQLLAALAHAGGDDPQANARAFRLGAARVGVPGEGTLPGWAPRELGAALDLLAASAYTVKERVLDAAAHVVLADGTVTDDEAALLRLIGLALDCPLPALLSRHVDPDAPRESEDLELARDP